jgi:hypothetical protein
MFLGPRATLPGRSESRSMGCYELPPQEEGASERPEAASDKKEAYEARPALEQRTTIPEAANDQEPAASMPADRRRQTSARTGCQPPT